jgi:hypothetical protein
MSLSRWLNWTPGMPITGEDRYAELTKPPKPEFVSFVSCATGPSAAIEVTVRQVVFLPVPCVCSEKLLPHFRHHDGSGPETDHWRAPVLDPLWGDACPCGGREWRKLDGPKLECALCRRVVRSEYLVKGGTR